MEAYTDIISWAGNILEGTCENLRLTPWKLIWAQRWVSVAIFATLLLALTGVMVFRDRVARSGKALSVLTFGALFASFLFVGLYLKAQPTTTNIVIILNGLMEGSFPIALFIMEPFLFLSFLFIGATVVLWGRGVFCGWLCPFGALVELLYRVYSRLFPRLTWRLPERVHAKLVYLKYVLLAMIVGASFYSFMLSEYIAEVEPFKTFVLKLNRQWYFVLYFLITVAASLAVYRAYCRYICPLGAALSLPSFIKGMPLIKLRRHELCGTCSVCGRECGYQAIGQGGAVNGRECMSCLTCQVNFWDEKRCPARIQEHRAAAAAMEAHKAPKLAALILLCAWVLAAPAGSHARTLNAGPGTNYPSIAAALKQAKNGDELLVAPGEYRERIRLTKAVSLIGAGSPVIAGSGGVFIEIAVPGARVEGFVIKDESADSDVKSGGIFIARGADNAVVRNNRLLNVMHGIWSVSARGVTIERNVILGKKDLERNYRGNGIYLTDSQEANVADNSMDYCRDGIYLEVSHDGRVVGNEVKHSRYAIHTMWADRTVFSRNKASQNLVGIAVMYSRQSVVTDNVAAGNETHGLLLNQTARSRIEGNTVIGNSKGVFFYNSVFNTLSSNLIMNNSLGLHNTGGSMDNTVEKNSFINNEVQVKFIAGRSQQWDGNYWSDYLGWDTTGTGTGELPYESNTVVDHILWRYPAAKLLYASASLQALWMMEKQFPLLKTPRVVDQRPSMLPLHRDWRTELARHPYSPERYFGDIDKLAISH